MEKQQLLEEMSDRLDRMGKLLSSEQGSQGRKLEDVLAARRRKKEGLKEKYLEAQEQAEAKGREFSERVMRIAKEEAEEVAAAEKELQRERAEGLAAIEEDLKAKKGQRLAKMEKRLEKLKQGGGKAGQELGDVLNEYGKLVK